MIRTQQKCKPNRNDTNKKKIGQCKISNTQGDIRICVVPNLFFSLMTYVIYCEQHEYLLKWKSSWSSHNLNKHFEHKVKQTSYSKLFERKKHADGEPTEHRLYVEIVLGVIISTKHVECSTMITSHQNKIIINRYYQLHRQI